MKQSLWRQYNTRKKKIYCVFTKCKNYKSYASFHIAFHDFFHTISIGTYNVLAFFHITHKVSFHRARFYFIFFFCFSFLLLNILVSFQMKNEVEALFILSKEKRFFFCFDWILPLFVELENNKCIVVFVSLLFFPFFLDSWISVWPQIYIFSTVKMSTYIFKNSLKYSFIRFWKWPK